METKNEQISNPENEASVANAEQNAVQSEQQENKANGEQDELKIKMAELNDKYLRLYSDFDNFRKRTAKEKIELIQSGGEDVFKSMLPVLDDFERAIKSNADITDVEAIKEGFNLIFNKFKNILTQKGLAEMKSAGEPFNTDLHEAITNIPAPSEDLKGKVVDELEKGYTLNGKVIRFAKVVIGN
jgi:molecular chaperone GrpE